MIVTLATLTFGVALGIGLTAGVGYLNPEAVGRFLPEIYSDPVDKLDELVDERGIAYVWHVETEQRRQRWLKQLGDYQTRHGEFDAIHIVVVDGTEELHSLEKQELEPYLS